MARTRLGGRRFAFPTVDMHLHLRFSERLTTRPCTELEKRSLKDALDAWDSGGTSSTGRLSLAGAAEPKTQMGSRVVLNRPSRPKRPIFLN